MAFRLTKETVELIEKNDSKLYGPLAEALNIGVDSIRTYLSRNSRRFTELASLQILTDFTGKPMNELIEEYKEDSEVTY